MSYEIEKIHKLEKACYPEHSFKIGFFTIFTHLEEYYQFLVKELIILGKKRWLLME